MKSRRRVNSNVRHLIVKPPRPFTLLCLLLAILPPLAEAQQRSPFSNLDAMKPTNCETNAVMLDGIPQNRFQGNATTDVVVVIARLGAHESSRELNRRRLFNVRYRLENYRGLNPNRLVLAEGDRVKGYGRIELYVDGQMFDVLVAAQNADLCVSCCGPNEDFYPARKPRRRK